MMLKRLFIGISVTLLSSNAANACSCFCKFEHNVSEYLENHKAFWGTPIQSTLTSNDIVRSEVEVLEGYGRISSGTIIKIDSQPEDGASCGIQLFTGVPQFIVASTNGENNVVSTCNCEPPSSYLLKYLKSKKDTYLPNLNDCWEGDDEIKSGKACEVWRDAEDDDEAEFSELMRMYKIQRESRKTK